MGKIKNLNRWLPWVCLALAFCGSLYYVIRYGNTYLDSDQAAELILGKILSEDGGIFSEKWYYSSALRVFDISLFLKLGFLLSPDNWAAARVIGQALVMLAFVAAYLYAGSAFGTRAGTVYSAAAMLCPFGFWYQLHVVMFGFYYPYMILTLIGLGSFLRLFQKDAHSRKDRLKAIFYWGMALASAFAGGLAGVRLFMNFFCPMLAASFVYFYLQVRSGKLKKLDASSSWHSVYGIPEVRFILCNIAVDIVYILGYYINSHYLSEKYSFLEQNEQSWSYMDFSRLLSVWAQYFANFGYPSDKFRNNTVSVFSIEGILGTLGLVTAAFLLYSVWRLVKRYPELPAKQRLIVVLWICIFVVDGIVFAFMTGDSNGSYWIPGISVAFAVMQMELETEKYQYKNEKLLTALALAVCIVGTSFTTVRLAMKEPMHGQPELQSVARWLERQGYTQGFAGFWESDVITAWTNGQVEMWTVDEASNLKIDGWLQKKSHVNLPQGRVFVILPKSEKGTEEILDSLPYGRLAQVQMAYEDDWYIVLSCDNANVLYSAVGMT